MGWRSASCHLSLEGHYNEEHMVDIRSAAILFPLGGFVVQQHTRAIGRNVPILQEYDVPVIITYRNIYDSILSWKESTDKDASSGKGGQYTFAPIYIPFWKNWSDEEKQIWVAYNITPWYLSFWLTWRVADVPKLWIRYDEFYADQAKGFGQILNFLGEPEPPMEVYEAHSRQKGGKFNVGKSGRGKEMLCEEAQNIINNQIRSWVEWSEVMEEALCTPR
jgi:hypothetical protein